MMILYTEHEMGILQPWPTPLDAGAVIAVLMEQPVGLTHELYVLCDESHGWTCDIRYMPEDDSLPPKINAVVLPNGQRWDATNRRRLRLDDGWFCCHRNPYSHFKPWFDSVVAVGTGRATWIESWWDHAKAVE